jgi:hypothetical protein
MSGVAAVGAGATAEVLALGSVVGLVAPVLSATSVFLDDLDGFGQRRRPLPHETAQLLDVGFFAHPLAHEAPCGLTVDSHQLLPLAIARPRESMGIGYFRATVFGYRNGVPCTQATSA